MVVALELQLQVRSAQMSKEHYEGLFGEEREIANLFFPLKKLLT